MTYYVGILDGAASAWGVRVPDLPGCHGSGSTPDAATADAISAVREWIAHQLSKGFPIPPARPIADIISDPTSEYVQGEPVVLLPALIDKCRPVRANLSLDAGLLEAIDPEAERRGLTRPAFHVSAALD